VKPAGRLLALPLAVVLASCHRSPLPQPVPDDANARIVFRFLTAYSHRDLDGMMGCLEEDAVFRGSGTPLSKPQIRAFFQATFRKHPNLRVEIGSVKVVQDTIHAAVKVETDVIWADTWIFEMRNHKIHAYSLASGRRQVPRVTSSG
jgi:ketosteroid isomerase-like protein